MRERFTQAFARPYVWILALALVSAVVYAGLFILQPDATELRAWLSRLTVTLLGSYVVAILVDLNFRRRDEERQIRIRNTALEELNDAMQTHINFLHDMYKASVSDVPDPIPESFEGPLRDDFREEVSHLNFAATYPTANLGPNHSWLDHSEHVFSEMNDDIDMIIGKYGAFLSPELIQDLRDLSNSGLTTALIEIGGSPILSGDNIHPSSPLGSDMPDHPLMQPDTDFFPFLADETWNEAIEEHAEAVLRVIEHYETSETPDLEAVTSRSRWREDVEPMVGSARIPSSVMQQLQGGPEQNTSPQPEEETE